jgi:hypothetical protein
MPALRARGRIDRPHQLRELLLADLDEVLARRDPDLAARAVPHLGLDLGAEAPLLHAGEERPGQRQVDVRLEQGEAHVAQGFVDAGFGELANAAEPVRGVLESLGHGLEHGVLRGWASVAARRRGCAGSADSDGLPGCACRAGGWRACSVILARRRRAAISGRRA